MAPSTDKILMGITLLITGGNNYPRAVKLSYPYITSISAQLLSLVIRHKYIAIPTEVR